MTPRSGSYDPRSRNWREYKTAAIFKPFIINICWSRVRRFFFQTEKLLIDNCLWKFNSLARSEMFLWQVILPICQKSIIFIFYLLKVSIQLNNTDVGIALKTFSADTVLDRSYN